MPGKNPFIASYARKFNLPFEAAMGGAETMYPEYIEKMKQMRPAQAETAGANR